MKKFLLPAFSLLFICATGIAMADAASPVKHPKHKKPHKHKTTSTLNPQPLPPVHDPGNGDSAKTSK